MITLHQAKRQDLEKIKTFYRHCGYSGGLKPEDWILMAGSNSQLVGVVRLCLEQNVLVLRGMQVLQVFQRQGIGKQLLQACTEQLENRTCYCIPWTHLRSFYRQGGFAEVSATEAPDFLQERFEGYLERGMKVSIMRRLPSTQNSERIVL
ncbi:GNAT family N-acetyltransferase [Acaryochloris sp. IP29b_bin.148]|uniref:GNAT family N-acetyltransferase n=1 Tax=Acaryochloris sp. IP29b_bin.148 TaxID=2969218 RepID=UPI00260C5DA0|nr:GNAT family N-acetyltransferase [Acaryochloris sp. IP29b_bin.148]